MSAATQPQTAAERLALLDAEYRALADRCDAAETALFALYVMVHDGEWPSTQQMVAAKKCLLVAGYSELVL